MATISTCLIVKNESVCIEKCINSILSFSDEIIIYDTGSDDGTQDICRSFDKVKVIQGEWREDFAWARNQSFEPATCDYIMWVDADDIIDEEGQKWLLNFKDSELEKYSQVDIEYIYDMNEDGSFSMHFYRERLFKRSLCPRWFGRIHEYPAITVHDDNYTKFEVPFKEMNIKHFKHSPNPDRNLRIYQDMESKGEINTGRDWFYYARECMWRLGWEIAIQKFAIAVGRDDLWNIDRLNAYMNMAWLFQQNGRERDYVEHVFKAASCTSVPRADVLCELGLIYKKRGNVEYARQCFLEALKQHDNNFGVDNTFMTEDKNSVTPALQLCVLEYEQGNIEESIRYNELAGTFNPNEPAVISNRKFFSSL